MKEESLVSLKEFNSFGVDSVANSMVLIENEQDLKQLDELIGTKKFLILGEGSNTLFSQDFDGIIIKIAIRGWEVKDENEEAVQLRVGAGENWHEFVLKSLDEGFQGLENLSLIPGSVGAAPIQNIGAYGVEVSNLIDSVEGFDLIGNGFKTLMSPECEFGYRSSIFKKELKDKFIVTRVNFKLNKKWGSLNTEYRSLSAFLKKNKMDDPDPRSLSEAVISIRNSKLPDPKKIGNAGSFFKNPIVDKERYKSLKEKFPMLEGFQQEDGSFKVFAGWLIQNLGWKGKKFGNAGVHSEQALVLVNLGGAKGQEIRELAMKLIQEVKKEYSIELEPEVRIV